MSSQLVSNVASALEFKLTFSHFTFRWPRNNGRYPHDCGGEARGFQVAVHIIQRLPYGIKVGEHAREVGEHARELFNHHGVGYQPCNNGLLLLLAVGDRKSAIRTGKGTQRVVTDDMVSDLLDATEFKRKLRAHDYAGGVQYILDQIASPLQQNQPTMHYKGQRAQQVLMRAVFWGLALSAFCLFWCPLAEVSVNITTAVDGTAVAVVSTLLATERVSLIFVGVLAVLRFALFSHHASNRDADFRAKLQRLQDTRERNAKMDGNVTTAPCAICLEELPNDLNFSCSACDKTAEILRCGHVFHEACINTWVSSGGNDVCPICRKKSPRFTTSAGGSRRTKDGTTVGDGYARTRPAPVDDEYYGVYYRHLGRRYRDVPGAVRMHRRNQTWSSCKQMDGSSNFNLCTYYDASEAQFRREQAAAAAARNRKSRSGGSGGGGGGGGSCNGGGGGTGSW